MTDIFRIISLSLYMNYRSCMNVLYKQ